MVLKYITRPYGGEKTGDGAAGRMRFTSNHRSSRSVPKAPPHPLHFVQHLLLKEKALQRRYVELLTMQVKNDILKSEV